MADLKYYDIIQKPIITEKSMTAMEEKKYTFAVHTGQYNELRRKDTSSWQNSWKDC